MNIMEWNNIRPDCKLVSVDTPQERFWKKVNKTSSCWLWMGKRTPKGYGDFAVRVANKILDFRAHRYAWEMIKGSIPKDKLVCHKCDNPPCVNPDHLYLGTQSENIKESVGKGRHSTCHQRGENNPSAIITGKIVEEIRKSYVPRKVTQRFLAEKFNLTQSYVSEILLKKVWSHI